MATISEYASVTSSETDPGVKNNRGVGQEIREPGDYVRPWIIGLIVGLIALVAVPVVVFVALELRKQKRSRHWRELMRKEEARKRRKTREHRKRNDDSAVSKSDEAKETTTKKDAQDSVKKTRLGRAKGAKKNAV